MACPRGPGLEERGVKKALHWWSWAQAGLSGALLRWPAGAPSSLARPFRAQALLPARPPQGPTPFFGTLALTSQRAPFPLLRPFRGVPLGESRLELSPRPFRVHPPFSPAASPIPPPQRLFLAGR